MNVAKRYHIYPGFATVGYPNRDSSIYKERYQIPEAQTIVRYPPPPQPIPIGRYIQPAH